MDPNDLPAGTITFNPATAPTADEVAELMEAMEATSAGPRPLQTLELSRGPSAEFVDRVADAVADRLVKRLVSPEARAMADAAASVPPLDALACSALADWLEERQFSNVSERVRKMAVQPGDLLVIDHPRHLSAEARHNIYTSMGRALDIVGLKDKVAVVLLQEGMTLKHIPLGKRS